MQQPQPQINIYAEETLLGAGFEKRVQQFTSSSGITYRFFGLFKAEASGFVDIFMPVFENVENYPPAPGKQLYIRAVNIPNQPLSELETYVTDATKRLQIFPSPAIIASNGQLLIGLNQIVAAKFCFAAPNWCVATLIAMEAQFSDRQPKQYTQILEENITANGPNNIPFTVKRNHLLMNGAVPMQSPELINGFSMYNADGSVAAPGASLVVNPGFMQQYVGVKAFRPTQQPNAIATIYGRHKCLDLISIFVVEGPGNVEMVQGPQQNMSGFNNPPVSSQPNQQQYPQQQIPGYQNPPNALDDSGMIKSNPNALRITDGMSGRITNFLDTLTGTGANALTKLQKVASRLGKPWPSGKLNKYLNLTTNQIGDLNGNKHVGREVFLSSPVPVLGNNLRLSMDKDDYQNIIHGNDSRGLEGIGREADYLDSFFDKVKAEIERARGNNIAAPEDNVTAVPVDILKAIPAGPQPARRTKVLAQTPFTSSIPLSGVAEVTVPVTDNKRCVPSLMAKKRD